MLFLMASPASATQTNPYMAQVPVSDRSETVRRAGFRDALAQVFIKISGDRRAPRASALAGALETADQYVQQFSYERREPPLPEDTPGTTDAPGVIAPGSEEPFLPWSLEVAFDSVAVTRLVRQAGFPVWAEERPQTAIWLAVEEQGTRSLLTQDTLQWRQPLQQAAQRRAIPITVPLGDLADMQAVPVDSLWAGYTDEVMAASQRYDTDRVLLGRVRPSGVGFEGRFSLLDPSGSEANTQTWRLQADSVEAVLTAAVEDLADRLGQQYALDDYSVDSNSGEFTIVVRNVTDMAGYGRVLRYLQALSPVSYAAPARLNGTSIWFDVRASGGPEQLERLVTLGRTLEVTDPGTALVDRGSRLPARLLNSQAALELRLRPE